MRNRLSRTLVCIVLAVILSGSLTVQALPSGTLLPAGGVLVFQVGGKLAGEIQRSGPDPSGPRLPVCANPAADDLSPRLDPLKEHLVFASDRQTAQDYDLYLVSLSLLGHGDCQQLTGAAEDDNFDDLNPAWSADGARVVFERRSLAGQTDLVLVELSTPPLETALGLEDIQPGAPAWSPDGQWIAFSCTTRIPPSMDVAHGLCKISPAPGSDFVSLPLPEDAFRRSLYPVWSPDSRRIAFTSSVIASEDQLWVLDLSSETFTCVYGPGEGCLTARGTGFDTTASDWASTGDTILLTDTAPDLYAPSYTWSRMRTLSLVDGSLGELSAEGSFEANPDWHAGLPASLWIGFADLPEQVETGQDFWIELEYGNQGELPAPDTRVMLSLPVGFSVQQADPAGSTGAGNIEWLVGELAGSASPDPLRVLVQAGASPSAGETISARIRSDAADPDGQQINALIRIVPPSTATPPPTVGPPLLPSPTPPLEGTPPAGAGVPLFLPLLAGP